MDKFGKDLNDIGMRIFAVGFAFLVFNVLFIVADAAAPVFLELMRAYPSEIALGALAAMLLGVILGIIGDKVREYTS